MQVTAVNGQPVTTSMEGSAGTAFGQEILGIMLVSAGNRCCRRAPTLSHSRLVFVCDFLVVFSLSPLLLTKCVGFCLVDGTTS
jgi:hypothetical protein